MLRAPQLILILCVLCVCVCSTYVTSRTVGIGAYLARLGQRVIQKNSLPIILTGFSALNKLLGKSVYTSNVQLGGPDIMYTNGVSHLTVNDDLEGCIACIKVNTTHNSTSRSSGRDKK